MPDTRAAASSFRASAEDRLRELRTEFEAGQARLREMELEVARFRETLLRVSGAIQVLQELLGQEPPPAAAQAAEGEGAAPATTAAQNSRAGAG